MKKTKFIAAALLLLSSLGAWAQSVGDVITYDGTQYEVKGANLFTNGSFDDGVSGWKTVNYTTDAVTSNFTISTTGGFDGGAYITTNGAGVGSANTIRQSVAVEAGKTYYFCVYTSGKAPSSGNMQYNALFKMTNATTEKGVLKQFAWPQGAEKTATTWSKTEFIFTATSDNPYVGVRMGWNSSSKFDGFSINEVELYFDRSVLTNEITTAKAQLATYVAGTEWHTSLSAAITTAEAANPTDAETLNAVVTALKGAEAAAALAYRKSLYADFADGDYYVKNSESGLFLNNGAYWGTRAVLRDMGIIYTLAKQEDGKYKLTSNVGGNGKLLNLANGFNDNGAAFEIFAATDGVTLCNGSQYLYSDGTKIPQLTDDANAEGVVWELISIATLKANIDNEVAGTNASFYIKNADFDGKLGGAGVWQGAPGVWGDNGQNNAVINSHNAQKWNTGNFDVYQEIENIPNGVYTLKVQAFYRHGNAGDASASAYTNNTEVSPILYGNDAEIAVKSIYAEAKSAAEGGWGSASGEYFIPNTQANAAACFSDDAAYVNTLTGIKVTNGKLKIGVKRTGDACYDWTVFDSFRLTYERALTEAEKAAAAKPNLAKAIQAAQAKLDGINENFIGEGAFLYAQSAIDAQQAIITAQQAVYDNEASTLAQITAATEAVSAVAVPALTAPAAGKVYNIVSKNADNWAGKNWALTGAAGARDNQGNYNIYFRAVNTNIMQALTLTQVEGNTYTISFVDADGATRYICDGTVYGGNTAQMRTTTEAESALQVVVNPNAKIGDDLTYKLVSTKNVTLGCQDSNPVSLGLYGTSSHFEMGIVETTKASVNLTVGEAGYATLISPFAIASLPEGMKAYTCSEVDGAKLTLTEAESIAANVPYIIEGQGTISATGDATGYETSYKPEGSLLTGVYAETKVAAGNYVLQNQSGQVAFYQVSADEGQQPTLKANRAYLTVPASAGVKAFYFDTETAIETAKAAQEGKQVIYDLQGRRVQNAAKGLYIINGKKVVRQ